MRLIISIFFTTQIIFNFLFSDDGDTPTNLTIDVASIGGVGLSWDTPENYRKEWITHSTLNIFLNGIGAGGVPNFVCQKFPDSLLSNYHGMLVKDIAFVPSADSDTASFQPLFFETDASDIGSLQIPDILGRSNLVLSGSKISYADSSVNQMQWNVIEMKDHVPGYSLLDDVQPSSYSIDSSKTIWFGYWLDEYSGFPSGASPGPAIESLGNVLIWCPATGCYESTLSQSSDPSLLNNWLLAISLIPTDSSSSTRPSVLSNNNNNLTENSFYNPNQIFHYNSIMNAGRIYSDIYIEPLINTQRDISNYFVFENGDVVDVVQPVYNAFNVSNRETTTLGPRGPGTYSYFVRAQTEDGLSDSSNIVTVELENNPPGNFNLISPQAGQSISINASNVNSGGSFIWTTAYDTDGQELNYLFELCKVEDGLCFDTTMTERIYQPTYSSLIDYFGLTSDDHYMFWSVKVTDGIDTLGAGGVSPDGADSLRYFTFSISQLGLDLASIPDQYGLSQNYPNPFNPSTRISYQIGKNEFVNFSIFDLNGNLIRNILNHKVNSGKGYVHWDGKNELGQIVSGGIYFYTIETPSFSKTKKMIFLK